MAKPLKLSTTMQQCVDYIRTHGAIHRHQGGFWANAGWILHSGPYFDAGTLNALVKRGVIEYSEWRGGRSGRFPIKAVLLAPAPESAHGVREGEVSAGPAESLSERITTACQGHSPGDAG